MTLPDTRNSIIARLSNSEDVDAWNQFAEIYRPVILRLALAKGLQESDAEDLAQTILVSVSQAIDRWDPEGPAKFRTWLKRVADNAILNALARGKPDKPTGSTTMAHVLDNVHGSPGPDSALLQLEYRREIFQWAANRIQPEFSATTWQAFWLTAVEAIPAEEVGKQLGRNRGSIYAARSRVMRRLLSEIEGFESGESHHE